MARTVPVRAVAHDDVVDAAVVRLGAEMLLQPRAAREQIGSGRAGTNTARQKAALGCRSNRPKQLNKLAVKRSSGLQAFREGAREGTGAISEEGRALARHHVLVTAEVERDSILAHYRIQTLHQRPSRPVLRKTDKNQPQPDPR